jgi:hypothetical protein
VFIVLPKEPSSTSAPCSANILHCEHPWPKESVVSKIKEINRSSSIRIFISLKYESKLTRNYSNINKKGIFVQLLFHESINKHFFHWYFFIPRFELRRNRKKSTSQK